MCWTNICEVAFSVPSLNVLNLMFFLGGGGVLSITVNVSVISHNVNIRKWKCNFGPSKIKTYSGEHDPRPPYKVRDMPWLPRLVPISLL